MQKWLKFWEGTKTLIFLLADVNMFLPTNFLRIFLTWFWDGLRNGENLQTIQGKLLIFGISNNGSDNNLHDENAFLRQRWDHPKEKKLKVLLLSLSLMIVFV